MKIINIALSLAVSGMGVTLAAPSGPIFGRQSLSLPTGQGALHLLNPSGTAVGCLNYFGMVVADPNSASCYQYFNADEYSDDKSASFADNRGPCTFYPFSDGSYNYTCSSESFAPKNQFQYSTFQEYPNNTLYNTYENRIYVYAYRVATGETISRFQGSRTVKLMVSFVQ